MHVRYIKIISAILAMLLLFTSCGVYKPATGGSGGGTGDGAGTGSGTGSGADTSEPFTVSLSYGGRPFIPTEEIGVMWNDGFSVHTSKIGEDGTASVSGLDGDYKVTLTKAPAGFAYDPNAYTATNDRRSVVIELQRSTDLKVPNYNELYRCISLRKTGVYTVDISSAKEVFFEFAPSESGTYSIFSWIDVTANTVNPVATYYGANSNYKIPYAVYDDGGEYYSTYTKNFSFIVEIADQQISTGGQSAFTFGIKTEERNGKYPIKLCFAITLDGEFELNLMENIVVVPEFDLEHQREYGSDYEFVWPEVNRGKDIFDASLYKLMDGEGMSIIRPDGSRPTGTLAEMLSGEYINYFEHENDCHNVYRHIRIEPDAVGSLSGRFTVNEYVYTYSQSGIRQIEAAPRSTGTYSYSYERVERTVNGRAEVEHLFHTKYVSGDAIDNAGFTLGADGVLDFGECDRYYHLYDSVNDTYGPILYANISTPTRFLGENGITPLTGVELAGNKALTINGNLNYKMFIEGITGLLDDPPSLDLGPYFCVTGCPCREETLNDLDGEQPCIGVCAESCAKCSPDCRHLSDEAMALFKNLPIEDSVEIYSNIYKEVIRVPKWFMGYSYFANSDGVHAVTAELQYFLQNFCTSQLLFFDGKGWVETHQTYRIYAGEDAQWLFACGYYKQK
ncbi:MAG: hypothetical protein IJY69_01155 [Clostridia bacterium]|nr:hypothetical protein [Clostridia bacterium]